MVIDLNKIREILEDKSLPIFDKKMKIFKLIPDPTYEKVCDLVDEFGVK